MDEVLSEEEFKQALIDLTLLGVVDYDENSDTFNGFTEYGRYLIRKATAELYAEKPEVFKKDPEAIFAEVAIRVLADAFKDKYHRSLLSIDDPMVDRLYNAFQVLTFILDFLYERWKEDLQKTDVRRRHDEV